MGERVRMKQGNMGCRGLSFSTDIHQTDKEQKKSPKIMKNVEEQQNMQSVL